MLNIKPFESKKIRPVWNEEEQKWYFSVVDVIEALTDSDKPRDYWYRLKRREKESSGIELSTFCRQLNLSVCPVQLSDISGQLTTLNQR